MGKGDKLINFTNLCKVHWSTMGEERKCPDTVMIGAVPVDMSIFGKKHLQPHVSLACLLFFLPICKSIIRTEKIFFAGNFLK